MKFRSFLLVLLLALPLVGAPQAQLSMQPVSKDKLCVTEGEIKELSSRRMSVNVPKMRAFVTDAVLQEAEISFTYFGPTKETAPLSSGEVRRQLGLKLRAQDACNLVYVMWRFEPTAELVVSVKSNPGMSTSAQCDANGYRSIKPDHASNLPAVKRGHTYTLRAIMEGSKMRVFANNNVVWQGDVGSEALAFHGPVGVRSDNVRFNFELFASHPAQGQAGATAVCHAGSGDE